MGLLLLLLHEFLILCLMQSQFSTTANQQADSTLPPAIDICSAPDGPVIQPNQCGFALDKLPPCSLQRLGPMAMYLMHVPPQITLLRREDILQVPDTKLGSGLFSEVVKVQVKESSFTEPLYAAKVMIKRDGGTRRPHEYGAVEITKLRFVHPGVIAPIAFAYHRKNTILLFRHWNGLHLSHWKRLASWDPTSPSFQFEFVKLANDSAWLDRLRKQTLQLIYAFCSTMHYVHAQGMLHNDLHSANILFHFSEKNENVYIGVSDWGRSTEKGTEDHYPSPPTNADAEYVKQRRADRPNVAPEVLEHNPPPWNETHQYYTIGYHVLTLLDLYEHSSEAERMFALHLRALAIKARALKAAERASPWDFLELFKMAAKYGVPIEEFSGMRPDDE